MPRPLGLLLVLGLVVTSLTIMTGSAQSGGGAQPFGCQLLGTSAGNPGGAPTVFGIAVDQGGQIHVASQQPAPNAQIGHSLQRFGSDGVRTSQIDLGVIGAIRVATDPAGSSYVAAAGLNSTELRRYAPDGTLDLTIPNIRGPIDVAPDGTIFASVAGERTIERYDATGAPLPPLGPGGPAVTSEIAVDAAGNVYLVVLEPDRVERYDPSGALTLTVPLAGTADAMVVDAAGRIYVLLRFGDLLVFDAAGTEVARLASPRPQSPVHPRDVAVAPDGAILLADETEVWRYADLASAPVPFPLAVGEGIQQLAGVSLNPASTIELFALDSSNNQLYRLSSAGTLLEKVDLATLTPPVTGATGMVAADGFVWILAGSTATRLGPLTGGALTPIGAPSTLPAPGRLIQGDSVAVVVLDTAGGVTRIAADGSATPVASGPSSLIAVASEASSADYGVDPRGQVFRLDPTGAVPLFGPSAYPVPPVEITGLSAQAGTIWVTDAGTGTVYVFDATGQLLGSFGPGTAVPAIERPMYVSLEERDGPWQVIVGDAATNRLHRLNCTVPTPAPVEPTPVPIGLGPQFTG